MIYAVKARYIEEKMAKFYQKLTDGTIQNQKPDGQEIINSMKRAKIIETEIIDNYSEFEGESFFDFLEKQFKNK